jgi:hypothetical protein
MWFYMEVHLRSAKHRMLGLTMGFKLCQASTVLAQKGGIAWKHAGSSFSLSTSTAGRICVYVLSSKLGSTMHSLCHCLRWNSARKRNAGFWYGWGGDAHLFLHLPASHASSAAPATSLHCVEEFFGRGKNSRYACQFTAYYLVEYLFRSW